MEMKPSLIFFVYIFNKANLFNLMEGVPEEIDIKTVCHFFFFFFQLRQL